MASANNIQAYYLLQPSFATGEISKEVANRVDLDKYQFAMTRAENCLIRPYGPVYKRPGSIFCTSTKYPDKKSILIPFAAKNNESYLLEFGDRYFRVHKNGEYLGVEKTTPYPETILNKLRITQSADTMFIASGEYPLQQIMKLSDSDWTINEYIIDKPYFDETLGNASVDATITPSAINGSVTLTSNENIFNADMVGQYVRLIQEVASVTESKVLDYAAGSGSYTSDGIYVGEGWKIITHNTWTGTVTIELSEDNVNWKEYRKYTANDDYNVTESGSFTEGRYLRFVIDITKGKVTVDLTALSYNNTGTAKITAVTDAMTVTATVVEKFGNTQATYKWALSAWGEGYGYPKTVAFFQDRLCLGGSRQQPYMLWLSRTGDYSNFSIEKVNGKLTDDSAVALSLISRKQFEIRHLVPSTDLIIYTEGNEWILSGNDVITPGNATPKMQTTRGCGDIEPMIIGSKTVFVQGRGSIVRDMGYSYETDSYGGVDLTLLAKHIIRDNKIVDAAYMQEPDSAIYFVRQDGTIAVLSYVIDQKVYAWSTIKTDGKYEAVATVANGDIDIIYVVVAREINGETVRYIERFKEDVYDSNPNNYIAVDSAVQLVGGPSFGFTAPNLAGKTINVLADTRPYYNIIVDRDGNFKLPTACKNVTAGMSYSMNIELPNVEIKTGDGSMQGRKKIVSNVMLRLENSLGGKVGSTFDMQDDIVYEEYQAVENVNLFSGDKEVVLPIGGFNNEGRVAITNNDPYPFNVLAIVREVSFGG